MSRRAITLGLSAALMLTACERGAEPEATSAAPAIAAERMPEVDVTRIERDARWLADDAREGRDTGSAGYAAAAEYVAQAMAEAGLEAGGTDGYLQAVPYLRNQLEEGSTTMVLHRADGDTELSYSEDYLMGGDRVRAAARITAPVVFVGYGIVAPELGVNDFDGIDVEGKIVLRFSGAPPNFAADQRAYYSSGIVKAEFAVARGAVGTIEVRTHVDRARNAWSRLQRFAGRPGMSWLSSSGEASRFHPQLEGFATLSDDAADALFASLGHEPGAFLASAEDLSYQPTELGFEATLSRRTTHQQLESPNVVGVLRGSDPALANEFILYTAHLDHNGIGPASESGDTIYNGFYDNALGVSIMLETARALGAMSPRRSILFVAVSGEEKGLLGADYFAHHPTVPVDAIVANVNLDMAVFLDPVTEVIAFGAEHSSLGEVAAEASRSAGWTLVPDPIPEQVIFVRSDHYMLVRAGIPAIYLAPNFGPNFQTFLSEHYHQPSDQDDLLVEWDAVADFTRVNALIGARVADAAERPRWNDGDFFGDRFGR